MFIPAEVAAAAGVVAPAAAGVHVHRQRGGVWELEAWLRGGHADEIARQLEQLPGVRRVKRPKPDTVWAVILCSSGE